MITSALPNLTILPDCEDMVSLDQTLLAAETRVKAWLEMRFWSEVTLTKSRTSVSDDA
jgi:hypothetical protein